MKNEIETMKNLFQRRSSITDYKSYYTIERESVA